MSTVLRFQHTRGGWPGRGGPKRDTREADKRDVRAPGGAQKYLFWVPQNDTQKSCSGETPSGTLLGQTKFSFSAFGTGGCPGAGVLERTFSTVFRRFFDHFPLAAPGGPGTRFLMVWDHFFDNVSTDFRQFSSGHPGGGRHPIFGGLGQLFLDFGVLLTRFPGYFSMIFHRSSVDGAGARWRVCRRQLDTYFLMFCCFCRLSITDN